MTHHYVLADVFTDRVFGGNPLAVFLEPGELTTAQMQAIAAELNLSETTFLGPPPASGAPRSLRIFTPKVELPFAGHPTIGTAFAMAWAGLLGADESGSSIVFQEGAGPIDVRVDWRDGEPVHASLSVAGPAQTEPAPTTDTVAAVLGLTADDIGARGGADRLAVRCVSMGVPFTMVPVRNRDALARARVDPVRWQETLADSWAPHFYVFTDDAEGRDVDFRARMFAPAMGIAEDPATGAVASAFAGYLAALDPAADGTERWLIEQGIEMGRRSLIAIAARMAGGVLEAVEVGGGAVRVGEGRLCIPT